VDHWYGDTVIDAIHKQAIVTLELKVVYFKVDNGKEFADHQAIDQALGIQTQFTDPYCSWKCGSNENFKEMLRHYIPKKLRNETVTEEEFSMIENRLNHRTIIG
jgi:IS30 family transposase